MLLLSWFTADDVFRAVFRAENESSVLEKGEIGWKALSEKPAVKRFFREMSKIGKVSLMKKDRVARQIFKN